MSLRDSRIDGAMYRFSTLIVHPAPLRLIYFKKNGHHNSNQSNHALNRVTKLLACILFSSILFPAQPLEKLIQLPFVHSMHKRILPLDRIRRVLRNELEADPVIPPANRP